MADQYITLAKAAEAEIVEKKSVFIAYAARATTEEEAQAIIQERCRLHADATHNVYAYYIRGGAVARYSDDGEPQGTSGVPTLNVLRMSGADDLCVVVTRYFGGILLGAGGLARAYSAAARAALEAAGIAAFDRFTVMRVCCTYSEHQKLQYELEKVRAITDSTEYGADVTITFAVRHDKSEGLRTRITEMFASRAEAEIIGERFDTEKNP